MNIDEIEKFIQTLLKITVPAFLIIFITFIFISALSRPRSKVEYGVTFSDKYAKELGLDWKEAYIKILDDLNVKRIRLIAYWDEVEKREGVFDFRYLDFMLSEAQKRNVSVILAIGRKLPRWPECHEPSWAKGRDDTFIKSRLLVLLTKEVEHFRRYRNIKYWQVENEPFFPFGKCPYLFDTAFIKQEVALVRALDERPILVSDSGEGGFWLLSYDIGDELAISMYRRVWLSFMGYFRYPLPPWTYRVKAALLNIPLTKIINSELQAEPWTKTFVLNASEKEIAVTMDHKKFQDILKYAKKTGIHRIYLWGVEWWYYKKNTGDPFYWNTAKRLFNQKEQAQTLISNFR